VPGGFRYRGIPQDRASALPGRWSLPFFDLASLAVCCDPSFAQNGPQTVGCEPTDIDSNCRHPWVLARRSVSGDAKGVTMGREGAYSCVAPGAWPMRRRQHSDQLNGTMAPLRSFQQPVFAGPSRQNGLVFSGNEPGRQLSMVIEFAAILVLRAVQLPATGFFPGPSLPGSSAVPRPGAASRQSVRSH